MRLASYAKVNFGLRVLGRRPDGYHAVKTILQTIDLVDEVELQLIPEEIELRCNHPAVPLGRGNLAYQAAQVLREETGTNEGVRITIVKRIPVGAGLGGGSSNAATVLMGLNRLWGLNLPQERLSSLAAQIGADVPFFLKGGMAYATGRGDELHFLPFIPEVWLVLFWPGFTISTAWAYENLGKMTLTREAKNISLSSVLGRGFHWQDLFGLLHNDFEPLVKGKHPVVEETKVQLLRCGALGVAMSGTGPTVYGIFEGEDLAREACLKLKGKGGESFFTRPIRPKGLPPTFNR